MVVTSSACGILAVMVLWLKYPAVGAITVSPVNVCRRLQNVQVVSILFPPASRLICFPSGTPHEVSIVDGRYSVPVLCISCGRGSTKLPYASVVAKSENSDGRSAPVECISGPCAGCLVFWNWSTSKCRPLRYTQSACESVCLFDRSVGNCSSHFGIHVQVC